ncbi:DUF222 domain-containing protein [Geodermatophilus sp. SYSU D00691]
MTQEQAAAELQRIDRDRARAAAREAALIARCAEHEPDTDDPQPGTPGARSRLWRVSEQEFAGVSEFAPSHLGAVVNVSPGTAAHRMRRAVTWRASLPSTLRALSRGELDERRGQILADTLVHTDPALARRVEALVLPEAPQLTFAGLRSPILAVLLALDPQAAEENRARAQRDADVFAEPAGDGMVNLGARLPADEAAEADGDTRPSGQLRAAMYSLLARGAAAGLLGARARLLITASLASWRAPRQRPRG